MKLGSKILEPFFIVQILKKNNYYFYCYQACFATSTLQKCNKMKFNVK